MPTPVRRWMQIALFNLLLVAAIGVVLRYKIAYSLPFIDQKNLLHGHSHFAFAGWITHALMSMMIAYLAKQRGTGIFKRYRWLINANLFTAYGMLVSFPVQGYGLVSIIFSTLSIVVSYAFAVIYWKDLDRLATTSISHYWFKAALIFNALSSLGAFSLAFMMATKTTQQHTYLASVYGFLHFQYNGWFFFACMGFLSGILQNMPWLKQRLVFWLFAPACVPAYALSVLWLHLPLWIYTIVVAAALAQAAGWLLVVQFMVKDKAHIKASIPATSQWLLLFSAIAFSIKLLLQLASTIPSLSTLAFGFRPIVIGYLHLVLLGVISLFLIGFMVASRYVMLHKHFITGLKITAGGIILNETLLMVQGVADIAWHPVEHINGLLFAAALVIFSGLFILNFSQQKSIN